MRETPAMDPVTLHPIGWVQNEFAPPMEAEWDQVESEIVLLEDLVPALEGIEEFSHIIVIWWMHQHEQGRGEVLQIHPERREDLPLRGVFATRTPRRPNPLGMTVVQLLQREGNVLRVRGLDAYTCSPVVDIKPYLIRGDLVGAATVPTWLQKLWRLNRE
ncbi:MAG: tRNA (N6-threonylcarbamoyladenosine(37)-N6)-methyltransferase TrmO [Chloroflexi bacterium]|nr:tRNA (N6-threonylcarbamoyladenosine(37)-N6)-methyltransferase TrmO [Chloroflexota bacterium]